MRLFAADFAEVPGKLELTIYLTRILLPFLTLVAVAAALMGMLNSLGHFFIPALSPAMFNVAIIVIARSLVPLAPSLGRGADHDRRHGDAGWRPGPAADPMAAAEPRGLSLPAGSRPPRRRPAPRPAADGPGTIGMAATQINVFVNTVLATSQGTGAVSWLDFAFRLMYLPIGLFGVSIATAATPAISRLAAAGLRRASAPRWPTPSA